MPAQSPCVRRDASSGPALLALAAAALFACGGPNSVTGSVAGHELHVAEVVSRITVGPEATTKRIVLFFSDRPGLCSAMQRGNQQRGATSLFLILERLDADRVTTVAPGVGDFPVVSRLAPVAGPQAWSGLAIWDDNCKPSALVPGEATGGVVTLTQLGLDKPGPVTGSFELRFGSDAPLSNQVPDLLEGTFSAPACDVEGGIDVVGCE